MKRSYFLFFYNLIILVGYFVLLGLSLLGWIYPFYKSWFSYSLMFLSFLILPRFVVYNVDTNLWAFNLLFLCGGFGILKNFYSLTTTYSIAGYMLCVSISSFLMFVFFRQIFHFKLFTFLTLFVIILIVYENNLINFWAMIVLLLTIASMFAVFLIKTILRNMRKV